MQISEPIALVLTTSDCNSIRRIRRNIDTLKKIGYRILVSSPHRPHDQSLIYYPMTVNDVSQIYGKRINRSVIKKIIYFILSLPAAALVSLGAKVFIWPLEKTRYQVKSKKKLFAEFEGVNLIIVEEMELAPLAFAIKRNQKMRVIMELRDFYWENSLIYSCRKVTLGAIMGIMIKWIYGQVLRVIYRDYLPKANAVICVSYGHASKLFTLFNVNAEVILSAPNYIPDLMPASVCSSNIKLVYHGIASRERSIDLLISAVNYSKPSISLHLFLTNPQPGYIKKLKSLASQRIYFHDPVPYDELIKVTNMYDVGLAFFPPLHTSLEDALPNKFFEYIQARLAIITGPSPDMSSIINEHQIGMVTEDFTLESLISTIARLEINTVQRMKNNSHKLAAVMNFESEEKKLLALFSNA